MQFSKSRYFLPFICGNGVIIVGVVCCKNNLLAQVSLGIIGGLIILISGIKYIVECKNRKKDNKDK